ncbi:hypothetical protein [Sulfitobacter sp. 1A12056]|uniref:hypothetical protein n=1 Tax=Sulfitobacter sp. 1A12056 TaxID=3368592 RepID=UPI0037472354
MIRILASLATLLSLSTFALGQTANIGERPLERGTGLDGQVSASSEQLRLTEKLEALREELHQVEVEVARLDGLRSEVEAVKRELTDSLMEISNVLAVADRNLDASSATLAAAEAAIDASQSYLSASAILITVLGLAASFATWWVTQDILGKTADRLVKKLSSSETNGEKNNIIEEIEDTVHSLLYEDVVDNISFVMQNPKFRENLEELIDRTVAEKCGKDNDSSHGPLQFEEAPN